jgi:hypothetical protein
MILLVLAQMQMQSPCTPRIDTVRDTIYAVLTPARSTDALPPATLTPVVHALAARANSQGMQVMSFGNGPSGPAVDLRPAGASAPRLPDALNKLPPTQTVILRRGTAPYPDGVTADTIVLQMAFRVGADSTHASAPYLLRRVYILHIKQQATLLPANPQPVGPVRDTVLVQFNVTPDGTVDTSTFFPIRARTRASLSAVRAILPSLHFAPALATNGCPARTVLSQQFIVRPQ